MAELDDLLELRYYHSVRRRQQSQRVLTAALWLGVAAGCFAIVVGVWLIDDALAGIAVAALSFALGLSATAVLRSRRERMLNLLAQSVPIPSEEDRRSRTLGEILNTTDRAMSFLAAWSGFQSTAADALARGHEPEPTSPRALIKKLEREQLLSEHEAAQLSSLIGLRNAVAHGIANDVPPHAISFVNRIRERLAGGNDSVRHVPAI